MQHPATPLSSAPDGQLVEAARYALLRRLAFALRHQMVVYLQPIGMIAEVMERRLQKPSPDLAQLRDSVTRIHGFSRSAVQSCLDMLSWLAPDSHAKVPLENVVQECMTLLGSHFSFRGFAVRDEIGAQPALVARAALRGALPACLLALGDEATSPADMIITASVDHAQAVLTIEVVATEGEAGFQEEAPYRPLEWHEVQAMALADGIQVTHTRTGASLVIPLQPA